MASEVLEQMLAQVEPISHRAVVVLDQDQKKGTGPFLKKHQILQQQLQQMQREHEEIEYKLALQQRQQKLFQQQQSQQQAQHPIPAPQDPTLHFQLHQQQQQLQVLQQRQLELRQRQQRQEAELEKQYKRHQGSKQGRSKDEGERRLDPTQPKSSPSSSQIATQTTTRRRQVQHQPILLRPVVLPTSSTYDTTGTGGADGVSSSSSSSQTKNRHSPLYHNVPPPGQPLYRSLHAPYLISPSSLDFSAKAASSSPLSSPTTIASASPTLIGRNIVVTPPTGQQQQQQREREIRRSWGSMGGLQEAASNAQMRYEDEFDEAPRNSSTTEQQQQQPSTPLRRSLFKGGVSGRTTIPSTNTSGQRQDTPFSSLPPTYHSHHRHTASLPSLNYYQQHAPTGHSPSRPGSTSLESLPEGNVSFLPPTPQGVSRSYHDTTGMVEPRHSPFHAHDSPGHKMGDDQDHKHATMVRSVRSMPTPSTSSTSLAPQESQYAPAGMATSAPGMAAASISSSSDESVKRFLR
ncbi:hypothetical protein BG000_000448 [Podila horticola]|nr:hypothetical protein BG000_000448 [Podila horticola]